MNILGIYSNKGGVGKTTAAVNLSFLAAEAGLKTLVCDLDPQSAASFYFRVKPKLKRNAMGFRKGGKNIARSIKGTDYENLDILPADFTHRNLASTFNKLKRRKRRLNRILDPLRPEYNLIVLDCPPSISLLAENIFNVADYLLVPVIPTTLSVRSHLQLLTFLKKKNYAKDNIFAFFSLVDRRKKMHKELMATISREFKGILHNSIPSLSNIERMGIEREPVQAFAPTSVAAKSYRKLWQEVDETLLD
ncbi:MAG: ParA family protein [Candidatus Poribacteria bacterium]|nr:ParA family protein [Candidatus Poribacteria bacterium]MDE0503110.1 ParA family protein [Candidatus Poribacteria bacterium]